MRPIFSEDIQGNITHTSPKELSTAIIECINAGAKIINMSVGLTQPAGSEPALAEALDYALKHSVIIVVSAGNQGIIGHSCLTSHPWVIPVTACDSKGKPMDISNFGKCIGMYGLSAPGKDITSLAPGGKSQNMCGTSVAAPFVTGTIALLWSIFPQASATEIKSALIQIKGSRRTVVPPLLNACTSYYRMKTMFMGKEISMEQTEVNSFQVDKPAIEVIEPACSKESAISPQMCSHSKSIGMNGTGKAEETYVYAVGRIEARFSSLAAEKEFAQAAGREVPRGLNDQQLFHSILSQKSNRYLVRQMCWIMTIEGIETYILIPRDPADLDLLVEAIRVQPNRNDINVVIGIKGTIAPPDMCNGLVIPIVAFDQIYSFDTESLIKSIPRPENIPADKFEQSSDGLFNRIIQMSDNAGATDEHRALNYLSVRYPRIYAVTSEKFGKNSSLTALEVKSSRLSGTRKIVDVVFTYTDRQTDVNEKCFVRVDVTEEFPFLVTKMSQYYDR